MIINNDAKRCTCMFEIVVMTTVPSSLIHHEGCMAEMCYLEHSIASECGETSRRIALPTRCWWQQRFAAGRWCRTAGSPGGAASSLQVAPAVTPCSQHWCGRTNGRRRLGHDSACLEAAAKTPGCPWDCGWWGWAQEHGGELWSDKTGTLGPKQKLKSSLLFPMLWIAVSSEGFSWLGKGTLGDEVQWLQLLPNTLDHSWMNCYNHIHSEASPRYTVSPETI